MTKVTVIGGGVSGLSTAYFILKEAIASKREIEVTVLESDSRLGGKIKTDIIKDYLCEYGPNGFLDNKPDTLELIRQLQIDDKLLKSNPSAKKRYIFSEGELHKLPENPGAFLKSKLLSFGGKLRILKEPFTKPAPAKTDETILEFATRHMGKEAAEKLIDSVVAGIFGGKADELSVKACFPIMLELEKQGNGSLIRAMIKRMKEAKKAKGLEDAEKKVKARTEPGGNLLSFHGGMETLTRSLSSKLLGKTLTGQEIIAIDKVSKLQIVKADNTVTESDVVVLAVPAYAASIITRDLNKDMSKSMDEIPYAPITVVNLGYVAKELGHDLDGFGFLTPGIENRNILGVLWTSSIFSGQAPEGRVSIRVMVGGARSPEIAFLDDRELLNIVNDELRATMNITAEPEFINIFRHEKAIPQYTVGHCERLENIEKQASKIQGLFITGNAYRGIGVNDCITNSKITARKVIVSINQSS